MKLHYSQTSSDRQEHSAVVLIPYEITLLSNEEGVVLEEPFVLIPYEITLLSNTTD